jgi:peptidoglycan/xylan/chitin deacetylase (PgdA/CDA1 family)
MTRTPDVLENGSAISLWQAETCLESVNGELRALADDFVTRHKSSIAELGNGEGVNSRLDVKVIYSRTGVSWMSFIISAHVVLNGTARAVELTTRTYDMKNGSRICLKNIFDDESIVWGIIEAGVRKAFLRYYPDVGCDTRVMEQLLKREKLREAEFTLRGMSLVLHYPASRLFEGKFSIIHIPFNYLELYGHMNPDAFEQTDNKRYYKMISLTYSNGPSYTETSRLLNVLMEKGVRATFFINGKFLENNTGLVRREYEEGHSIGGQNWLNTDVRGWPAAAIRAIRPKFDSALTAAIGIPSAYNRAPYGKYKPMIESKAAWAMIQWSVDSKDLSARTPEEIVDIVARQADEGDIILLHDSNPRCDLYTKMVIDRLENDGFLFLTIDEMFAKDRVPFFNDTVYYRCLNGDFSEKK